MEIILKSKGADILLRREALTGTPAQSEPLIEKQVSIEHEQIGCITDTQITTSNFFIAHCSFQLTQPIQLIKEVEEAVIQLDFSWRGECQAQPGGKATRRQFSTGQHNISYLSQSRSEYTYGVSAQPLEFSVVVIPKDVYARLVPADSELYRQLFTQIGQQKAAYLSHKNLPITPAMDWLIRDMRASQRTGALKHLFLESRILELLMLQLEQLQGTKSIPASSKRADIRKIHEACDLLDAYYPNPPTIVELAKLVGLNEFSLKRGFKEQVGMTILGYMTKRRMEDARRLLLEGEKTISEISYWVGYKNPAHFTVAFKHYFGLLPSAIRMQPDDALA